MSRYKLISRLGEHQIAHLGASVNVVDRLQTMRVPEPDASVGGATSSREQTILIWVPSYGFNCSLVLAELCKSVRGVHVPYHELVVIASTCELLPIEGPFESADLLLVASVPMGYGVGSSKVPAKDHSVSRASGYGGSIPRNSTDSPQMSAKCSN